jgi:hypothetical protein
VFVCWGIEPEWPYPGTVLSYEGEHGLFDAVAKTGYFYIAMDYYVAVSVEPRRKNVSDHDAAGEYGQAFRNAHVTMDDATYDRGPGHKRSIATRAFTDNDLAGGPDGTTEVTIDANEAFYDEVTAE